LLDGQFLVVFSDGVSEFPTVSTWSIVGAALQTLIECWNADDFFAPVNPLLSHMGDLATSHPESPGHEDDEPREASIRFLKFPSTFQEQLELAVGQRILFGIQDPFRTDQPVAPKSTL
jgi:hypothetical protein